MKKIFSLTLLLLLSLASSVRAEGLLVVQSLPIKPYDQALAGFRTVCTARITKIISSELNEADTLKKARKTKPDLILAIGLDALQKVRTIRDVPIIYLMVPNPQSQSFIQDNNNVTGVSMNIEPERQFSALRQVLPHARRIAVLYDPDKSGHFVRKAQSIAATAGFELVLKMVHSSQDAAAALEGLKTKMDALWLLPDTTVVNPATIDLLLLTALENRIPIFTFSRKSAEKGAMLSLEIDAQEAGKQAGEMANRILSGEDVHKIGEVDARGGILTVNMIVAKKLGITPNSDLLKQANAIQIGNK